MIALLSWVGALFVLMSVRDRTLRIALYCLFAAASLTTVLALGPTAKAAEDTPAPSSSPAPKPSTAPSPKPEPSPEPAASPAPERDNNDLTDDEKKDLIRAELGADAERMICIVWTKESGGNAHARNRRSGASGAFQFTGGSATGSFRKDVKRAKDYVGRRGFQPWGNACGGGGSGGGGGSVPVACIDHTEWQDVTWTVVVSVEACDLPEPPDWAEDQRPSQGCGWTALETDDPKWMCSSKLGPGQSITGKARIQS